MVQPSKPASSSDPSSPAIIQCATLDEVTWPEEAVFLVDQGLPASLRTALPSTRIEVDGGESIKQWSRIAELAQRILEIRSTRPLHLVAVGGGAVGDAVGFLASVLWRGVNLWHAPSTLLAMVDSAHGGKTAVNLAGGKNQLGTFYPADKVVISHQFLDTLPLELREQGFVELLKALWLKRPEHLSIIDEHLVQLLDDPIDDHSRLWSTLLSESIAAKYEVVALDPQETSGHRRILNLGHTTGHGVEAITDLSHGHSIAWGLAACALLSHRHADLSDKEAHRLLDHLRPFLRPLPPTLDARDHRDFLHKLDRDKKWQDGRLISILLDAPGAPTQVDSITPDMWWEALLEVRQMVAKDHLHVAPRVRHQPDMPSLPVDKSRANRTLIAAHLRPGSTTIQWPPSPAPDDVIALRRALQRLDEDSGDPTQPLQISAAKAGTTGRFLLALSCLRHQKTLLHFDDQLRSRPHQPLIDALCEAGATIEATDSGYAIEGWSSPPEVITVDPSLSSQFGSALALLAAGSLSFELRLSAPLKSAGYFAMTLDVLRDTGVDVDGQDSMRTITFEPTPQLEAPWEPVLPGDTSSAALWHILAVRTPQIQPPPIPSPDHSDAIIEDILDRFHYIEPGQELTVSLADAPDLAPVLCALATQIPQGLIIEDAAHLRHKESNRIDTLCDSFGSLGITIEPRPDGLRVPPQPQPPTGDIPFPTAGDHRLAMAALVAASQHYPVTIAQARCVQKSYPDLWRQLRRQGFELTWSSTVSLT